MTMPIAVITRPHLHLHDADLSALDRDTIVLTAEERRWSRRRVTTTGGRQIALALPTGSVMKPGDVLYVARESGWYVVVEAAREPVIAVTPTSRDEAIRIAFEVGNRHFAVGIDGDRLMVPDDPAMEQLLTRMGVMWEHTRAVFSPLGITHRHD